MSRVMKSRKEVRKSEPARKKSGGGTLIGMFIGLVLGVAIAAGVIWYMNNSPLPFTTRHVQSARPGGAMDEPLVLPGKPGDPVPEKRFQFYDILPGKTDAVSDPVARPAEARKEEKKNGKKEEKKDEAKEGKAPLFLQVGSFSTAQDADNQKAKLAFMGIEAAVQQVMIKERTLYRVRVGPFPRIDELNETRAELAKSGIEVQLAK